MVVLGVQVAFILWLGERRPIEPRPTEVAPGLKLFGSGCAEMMEILDPTLFALPHARGFSGPGWLIPPTQEIQPFAWSEPRRWLTLATARLGTSVNQPLATNEFEPMPALARPDPEPLLARLSGSREFPDRSRMYVEGDLAARRLLSNLELPSWPHNDLVSNSVVQLVVDAEGIPFSVTLLSRSGYAAADTYALNEARARSV